MWLQFKNRRGAAVAAGRVADVGGGNSARKRAEVGPMRGSAAAPQAVGVEDIFVSARVPKLGDTVSPSISPCIRPAPRGRLVLTGLCAVVDLEFERGEETLASADYSCIVAC